MLKGQDHLTKRQYAQTFATTIAIDSIAIAITISIGTITNARSIKIQISENVRGKLKLITTDYEHTSHKKDISGVLQRRLTVLN